MRRRPGGVRREKVLAWVNVVGAYAETCMDTASFIRTHSSFVMESFAKLPPRTALNRAMPLMPAQRHRAPPTRAGKVELLGYNLWLRRFQGDRNVVGAWSGPTR